MILSPNSRLMIIYLVKIEVAVQIIHYQIINWISSTSYNNSFARIF